MVQSFDRYVEKRVSHELAVSGNAARRGGIGLDRI